MQTLIDKINTKVVGTSYRDFNWDLVRSRDLLEIRPEHNNPKDHKALAIWHKKAGHIGYIAAKDDLNVQLYEDVRGGRDVYAQVTEVTGVGLGNRGIDITVFVVEEF